MKYFFVHYSLNNRHSAPILRFLGRLIVSLKLEVYIFTVSKTKMKLTKPTVKALCIVFALHMYIDLVVSMGNTSNTSVTYGKEI